MTDALIEYARTIAAETGRYVPTPNPNGPTTTAGVLFLLRDPGATETSGANETGVLDPYLNRDPTSLRQRRALETAGIDRAVCVWWNAVPYHLGYKGDLRDSDAHAGARYLLGFLERCHALRVVVAMGSGAQSVATLAWSMASGPVPHLLCAPHPMIYGRGARERMAVLATRLEEAARLIHG